MPRTETYSIPLDTARKIICQTVVEGSLTGELCDDYTITTPAGRSVTLVFEKHFYRAGNRLTLTVVLDDFTGPTRVHCCAGGGGEGFFRFDWGASKDFEEEVFSDLDRYKG
ncbi:MAG: hypothetical protein IJO96_05415 [Oscillospiraceae bacterium]|nr:hypothetical protein [Oscillospiraceae bacterium]